MEEIQQTEDVGPPAVIRVQSATGDLRLHEFHSRIFRNTRFLRVWLPSGYDDSENSNRRYPVLYLNDGQNLFEPATSFNGVEWQVDETADRLIREGAIPPMIIVGMDNAARERIREYMPHRSLHPVMLRVYGTRYPSFLFKEVIPFMARNYRVASEAGEYRTRRFFARSTNRTVHGGCASRSDRAFATREPFPLGFEPATNPAESCRQALAGTRFSRHWNR